MPNSYFNIGESCGMVITSPGDKFSMLVFVFARLGIDPLFKLILQLCDYEYVVICLLY